MQQFLDSQHIKALDCPKNSPNLSPIENYWALMKAKESEKQPSNLEALRKVIKEVWVHKTSSDCWPNLMSSMPRRLQEIIKNKVVALSINNC